MFSRTVNEAACSFDTVLVLLFLETELFTITFGRVFEWQIIVTYVWLRLIIFLKSYF